MIMKYYADVYDIKKAYAYYLEVFQAAPIKDVQKSFHHASMRVFGQITFLLHQSLEDQAVKRPGWHIFRFEDHEVDLFYSACGIVRGAKDTRVLLDCYSAKWGTTIFEFADPFGYTWDFEISTRALTRD